MVMIILSLYLNNKPIVNNKLMLTKTKLIEQIEKFPEGFSIDELVERLILIEKVELGLKQSENGEIISDSDLDREIEQSFK